MTAPLRFAMIGAGFWAQYQLAAWGELPSAKCVAICNRTRGKAAELAKRFDVPKVYDDVSELFASEQLDFVDIITNVETHRLYVELAAHNRLPAICQKPLAPTLADALAMRAACHRAGVPLLVHENWRWQLPLREFKAVLDSGKIGRVFRGRIQYSNSFPVFENQPFLKDLDEFILTDIGTHILDVARFLFGEVATLYCRTSRVHPDIRGEDVATVMFGMKDGATVSCEMSYASRMEHDRFPETFVLAEGTVGSAELGPDYWIRVTTRDGSHSQRYRPPTYPWANPDYGLLHSSIVPCQENLLAGLRGEAAAETTVDDNLQTLALVFGSYQSARTGQIIRPTELLHEVEWKP